MKVLIFGNSGSGKSTLAKRSAGEHSLEHLDLDTIAWAEEGERLEQSESERRLRAWMAEREGWVIEGCYGSLISVAAEECTEMHFLNPGIEACLRNNANRPWEPHKYPSKEAQDKNLAMLQDWVREYETRDDEYSLSAHRRIFDEFRGMKTEYKGKI